MDGIPAVSPFVPGHGSLPPYLAGRDEECESLLSLLAYLHGGRGAPRDAVLIGPRGNGKTALLRWFEREIGKEGGAIDVVWLTPNEILGLDALANVLAPCDRFDSLRSEVLSMSIGVGKWAWELGDQPASLTRLLRARCSRQPLVVLLDEAHNLGTEIGTILLNASQSVAAEAPFLLVLAGTPNLTAHLNSLSATFWSRATQIGIGRLEPIAAGEAVARPLAAQEPQFREVLRLQTGLADLGYIWSPPGEANRWQPGIPSLMRYVEAHEAA